MGVETSPEQTRFKNLKEKPEKESSKRTISASVGLGHYKWYQSQVPGDVPTRRLSSEGGGHEVVCQQGR